MMRTKITLAVFALLLGSSACQSVNGQQSKWKPFSERRPLSNVGAMLNDDAEASDPAGIHYYAEDLAHFLLPYKAGNRYTNSFANRLAKAEWRAREGKRKLIPDTQIVEAFSEIAGKTNLPPMPASLEWLRSLRTDPRIAKEYPALITADRNGTNCYPGEAVYLLAVLLLKDAYPPPHPASPAALPPPPHPRIYRPGDLLPPPLPPPDPFAPFIITMGPMPGTNTTELLSTRDLTTVTLRGKKLRKSGRRGITGLFNSAAKTLGM